MAKVKTKRNEAVVLTGPLNAKKEKPEVEAVIAALAEAAESKPEAAVGTQVQWVFRNIPKNWPDIDSDNVPDPGAVELLRWAKQNPGNFYQTYHVRFLPSKTEVDRHAMARGSDMDLDRVDGILMAALEKSRAEQEQEHVCARCKAREAQVSASRDGHANGRETAG